MIEFGFSYSDLKEFEKKDIRLLPLLAKEVNSRMELRREVGKLDMADAVYIANIAADPDKKGRRVSAFRRWQRSILWRIRKLENKKMPTVWDNMPRKSRKLRG